MARIIDITNQKFGRLTAINIAGKDSRGETIWHCICDCGQTKDVLSSNLRKGLTQSCGCLQKEKAGQKTPIKNLTNQRFGKLIALEPTKERLNGQVIWKCLCDCGNITYIRSYNLISGSCQSCGCLSQSHGELKIQEILTKNNISYEKEKTFPSCIFEDTQQLARFDFYVNQSYIIEFDGEQHFTYNNTGWNTKEHYLRVKLHDKYKNQWCKDNNIPIIRIPYTHLKNLELSDLLIDTSLFRLEE